MQDSEYIRRGAIAVMTECVAAAQRQIVLAQEALARLGKLREEVAE